jgi:hypothetical protein
MDLRNLRILCVLLFPGLATGCSWLSNSAAVTIATGAPADTADALNVDQFALQFAPAMVTECQRKADAEAAERTAGSDAAKRCRNDIAYYRIRYYDANYYTFKRLVLAGNSSYNAGTDIAVLGLNAAGTLTGGATTKAILAAISGGLIGTRGVIDKDLYFNSSINTLIAQMDADRAEAFEQILKNLARKNIADYPLAAAEIDTGRYYEAGTLPHAIQSILKNAGKKQATADENTAKEKEKTE